MPTSGRSTGPVRIMCAADQAFAGPLCAMLVSVMTHHPREREIIIYILATAIPDADRKKIEAALSINFPHFPLSALHWLSPNRDILRDLPVSEHITLEAYSRLLAPFVLPDDCDRVLYLDSDLIALADVSPLYDSESNGKALHAAVDLWVGKVSAPTGVFNFVELGIPPETRYFNSGVLVMHLHYWRENKLANRVLDYLQRHKSAVNFHDQGAMNAILHDSWIEIDPCWNQTRAIIYPELWEKAGYTHADWSRVKDHPRIIHYTGAAKPWLRDPDLLPRPGYSYFFKYLNRTAYRDSLTGPRLERIIGYHAYFFLWQTMRTVYHMIARHRAVKQN